MTAQGGGSRFDEHMKKELSRTSSRRSGGSGENSSRPSAGPDRLSSWRLQRGRAASSVTLHNPRQNWTASGSCVGRGQTSSSEQRPCATCAPA